MTLILNEFEMYPTFKNPCFDFPLFKPFEKCARIHPPRFITVQPKIIIVTDSVIWFPHCLNKFTRDHYHRWSLFSSCRAGRDDYCISTVNLRCHLLKKRIIYLDKSIFLFFIFTQNHRDKEFAKNSVDTLLGKTSPENIFIKFSSWKSDEVF